MNGSPAMIDILGRGLSGWSGCAILAYTLGTTHLTIVAVTVYLHRCQAHRAIDLHPLIAHAFRLWLWLSTGMVTREWVAVHRKHHAFCERPGDPHSPHVFGLRAVLLRGTELYRTQATDEAAVRRFGRGTPDDWLERTIYAVMPWQGLGLLLLCDLALFGSLGLTVWAVQMLWIPVMAAGVINGLGHFWGYRNFAHPSAATNLLPFGMFVGGEELHGNHHVFPSSARLSVLWFECDIGWIYISLLGWMGLARIRHVVPAVPPRRPRAETISDATVRGLILHRHHVMRSYGRLQLHEYRSALHSAPQLPSWRARRAAASSANSFGLVERGRAAHAGGLGGAARHGGLHAGPRERPAPALERSALHPGRCFGAPALLVPSCSRDGDTRTVELFKGADPLRYAATVEHCAGRATPGKHATAPRRPFALGTTDPVPHAIAIRV